MSITFSSNDYVRFTSPTNALGLTSKTYFFDGRGGGSTNNIFQYDGASGDSVSVRISGPTWVITFTAKFTTTSGVWVASVPAGSFGSICITYDGSSTANNPVIYIAGVSQTVTKTTSPVGTYTVGANRIDLGFTSSATSSGSIGDLRVYNVIKTAAQAVALAAEDIFTDQNIDEAGLVFHAPLTMCKGLTYSTYIGSTLAAVNEFYDRVNGYVGVPSGSPVGA